MLRVNYTTYDKRRHQDVVKPIKSPDIMFLSSDDPDTFGGGGYPYLYAKVLSIFSVDVRYTGPELADHEIQVIDVLWVRWLAFDSGHKFGWKARRLPLVSFTTNDEPSEPSTGFIDPDLALRGVHLIPSFARGKIPTPSLATSKKKKKGKKAAALAEFESAILKSHIWKSYYVNWYVF